MRSWSKRKRVAWQKLNSCFFLLLNFKIPGRTKHFFFQKLLLPSHSRFLRENDNNVFFLQINIGINRNPQGPRKEKRRNCFGRSDNQKCQHYIFIRLLRSGILFIISHAHKSIHDKKAKPRISLSYGKAFAGNMTSLERAIVSRSIFQIYQVFLKRPKPE